MGYLRDHWHGRHALTRAFWINFLAPFVLIALGESWIRPDIAGLNTAQALPAALYVLVAYAVILPWQLIGLWRSSLRHLEEQGDSTTVTLAQSAVLVALLTAAGIAATAAERLFDIGGSPDQRRPPSPQRYHLTWMPVDRAIRIDGLFDVGLSRDFRALLAATPGIATIVLNSDGGRVFEARGIARQIRENRLDTTVVERCRSACTIAFIAGRSRKLGAHGRLGFHGYGMTGIGFIDPEEEQQKDRAFLLYQGASPAFVDRIFATPHDDMWHPEIEQLLQAGVVHRILTDR